MSVKAGFKMASKTLKGSICKGIIKEGQRYFEARVPFSKRVRNCIPCVRKAGVFTDEEIKQDYTATVTAGDMLRGVAHLKRVEK